MGAAPHAIPHAKSPRRSSTGGRIEQNLETFLVFLDVQNVRVDPSISLGSLSSHLSLLFLWCFLDSTSPQDVGLPYMTDGRHSPDTLFLVAENDFRFFKEHCVSDRNWLRQVDKKRGFRHVKALAWITQVCIFRVAP